MSQFISKSISNVSGIYMIRSMHCPTEFYIGGSKNIKRRLLDHARCLRKNKSKHTKLQNHVNKYGIEDLSCSIIKLCNNEHINYYEQYYISELKPSLNTFNFAGIKYASLAKSVAMKDIGPRANLLYEEQQISNIKNCNNSGYEDLIIVRHKIKIDKKRNPPLPSILNPKPIPYASVINGTRVRQLRDKFSLSQTQLACELEIERGTLQRIEYGQGGSNLCTAYKIAKYFNVTIESLIE